MNIVKRTMSVYDQIYYTSKTDARRFSIKAFSTTNYRSLEKALYVNNSETVFQEKNSDKKANSLPDIAPAKI